MDVMCINYCLVIFASLFLANVLPVLVIVYSLAGHSLPSVSEVLPSATFALPSAFAYGFTTESVFLVLLLLLSASLLCTCSANHQEVALDACIDSALLSESDSEGELPQSSSGSEDEGVVYEDSEDLSSRAVRETCE
jgi:hypothetical protein